MTTHIDLTKIKTSYYLTKGCGVQFLLNFSSRNLSAGARKAMEGKANTTPVMRIIFPDEIKKSDGTIINCDLGRITIKERWPSCSMLPKCAKLAKKLNRDAFLCEDCFAFVYGKVNNLDIRALALAWDTVINNRKHKDITSVYFGIQDNQAFLQPEQSMKFLSSDGKITTGDYLQAVGGKLSIHQKESDLIFSRVQRNSFNCGGHVSLYKIKEGRLILLDYNNGEIVKNNGHCPELTEACRMLINPNGNVNCREQDTFCQGIDIGGQHVAISLSELQYKKLVESFMTDFSTDINVSPIGVKEVTRTTEVEPSIEKMTIDSVITLASDFFSSDAIDGKKKVAIYAVNKSREEKHQLSPIAIPLSLACKITAVVQRIFGVEYDLRFLNTNLGIWYKEKEFDPDKFKNEIEAYFQAQEKDAGQTPEPDKTTSAEPTEEKGVVEELIAGQKVIPETPVQQPELQQEPAPLAKELLEPVAEKNVVKKAVVEPDVDQGIEFKLKLEGGLTTFLLMTSEDVWEAFELLMKERGMAGSITGITMMQIQKII